MRRSVTLDVQHDLDELGIAKNAREEKMRARAERLRRKRENERMAQLYRQHVLKTEAEAPTLVQIELNNKPKVSDEVAATVSGD